MPESPSPVSPRKNNIPLLWWPLLVILLTLFLDQLTKWLILHVQPEIGLWRDVIPGYFSLLHVHNTGGAWSILHDYTWLLSMVSIFAFTFILVFFPRWNRGSRFKAFLIALLSGGIAGNMLDRILRGYVVDFLDFHWHSHHWPTFNVADSAIVVAICALMWCTLREKEPPAQGVPSVPSDEKR